jgi:hypothetical protein
MESEMSAAEFLEWQKRRALDLSRRIARDDRLEHFQPWLSPGSRERRQLALATYLGLHRVSVPRLRFSSVRMKAGAGVSGCHGRDLTPSPAAPQREPAGAFPLTPAERP